MKRIVLAGGSGFLGNALAKRFMAQQYEVIVLTRTPRARLDGVKEAAWDGKTLGDWVKLLEGADAVVNLTGKNINCSHTLENLQLIKASRVDSGKAIAAAIAAARIPPAAWVQASAVGFYGNTGDKLRDETSANGGDPVAKICGEWEAACSAAVLPKTRKVILRIGVVLGREGGAFPVLAKLTKWFLGGTAGSGKQFISWIHLADLTRMVAMVAENERFSETFNAVAPNAVTNADFMRALRRALHRPWSPPAPKLAVELGARMMGTAPALVLSGQRCAPKRFSEAGFQFAFPDLGTALTDLCQ